MVATHHGSGHGATGAYMSGCGWLDKLEGTQRGIIMVPGGGGKEWSWQLDSPTNPNIVTALMSRLCDGPYRRRFVSIASDWTWGNDTIIERIGAARATAIASHGFEEKVHLIGVSMGGCCSLEYAKRNPSHVASITLIIPVLDQQDIYDNGRVDPYGTITPPEDAFGGNRPPSSHVPARNASIYTGMPVAIWYSNNDSVCVPEVTEPFGANAGAELNNLGDQFPAGFAIPGHAADNLPHDDVAAFLAEND